MNCECGIRGDSYRPTLLDFNIFVIVIVYQEQQTRPLFGGYVSMGHVKCDMYIYIEMYI